VLEVFDLTVKLGNEVVLDSVNFSLEAGEFLLVLGPNGAGKTTLFRTILGLVKPIRGFIRLNGVENPREVRKIVGYVPQSLGVNKAVPITVREFVGYPLKFNGVEDAESRLEEVLDLLKIREKADAILWNLSGGERQKALIARALAMRPKVLLLDEPFGNLDYETRSDVIDLLLELKRREHVTMLMATHHSTDFREELVDKILVLNRRVLLFGEVEEVLRGDALRELVAKYDLACSLRPLRQ